MLLVAGLAMAQYSLWSVTLTSSLISRGITKSRTLPYTLI